MHPNIPAKTNPIEHEPRNARAWGLVHEQSARKAYYRVERHTHHKLQLLPKGFLISAKQPFLGASLDNIRRCHCSMECPYIAVEYKCPWKHQAKNSKCAFLTLEIGGIMTGNVVTLPEGCPYYFQIQTQLHVADLAQCDLVIWTNQGIYTHHVYYNAEFMKRVSGKLKLFWRDNVLPVLLDSIVKGSSSALHGTVYIMLLCFNV